MNSVKVSVITPTYNRQGYIKKAIQLLKNQTLKDIEFIIVDDGSTDNSLDSLKQEVGQDIRFRILNQANKGPSSARNHALKYAKGEYIGFFDIDDEIPANYYELMYKKAKNTNADIVFTSYNSIKHKYPCAPSNSEYIKTLRNGAIWDKIYKKSLIEDNNIRFAEGLYTADNLWCVQTFSKAKKLILTNEPIYQYALQQDSIGKDKAKKQKRKTDIFIVIDKILKYSKDNNFTSEQEHALRKFLFQSYNCYPNDKKYCKYLFKVLKQQKITQELSKGTAMKLGVLKVARFLHLINKKKYNEKRQIELVKNSPLFDTKWYLAQNPDVKAKKIGAARHYVKHGWKEGRNPSPKFDGNAYLDTYDDIRVANMCPLVHYIINGSKEGRFFVGANNISTIDDNTHYAYNSFKQKIKDILTYPIRVKEEYDHLNEDIKRLSGK